MTNADVQRLFHKARTFEKRQDFARAHECYSAILEIYPDNVRARKCLLGLQAKNSGGEPTKVQIDELGALHSNEEYGKLAQRSRRLIEVFPSSFMLKLFLGTACAALRQYAEAESAFRAALAINPQHIDALFNLAFALTAQNKFDESIELYKKLALAAPRSPAVFCDYGDALSAAKRHVDALSIYRKALELAPRDHRVLFKVASACWELNLTKEAKSNLTKSLNVKPDYVEALLKRAEIYEIQENLEAAVSIYMELLNSHVENWVLRLKLINMLLQLGRKHDALELVQVGLELEPDNAELQMSLVAITKDGASLDGDYEIVERWKQDVENREIPKKRRAALAFSLSTILESFGNFEDTFHYVMRGNKLRKQYAEEMNRTDGVEWAKEVAFMNRSADYDMSTKVELLANQTGNERTPVFILGMPRSGTTLCEQILSNHPQVFGGGELTFLSPLVSQAFDKSNRCTRSLATRVRHMYLENVATLDNSHPYFTDKMPHNFLHIGLILCAFPEAKIIHLQRDPRAVCWSCLKQDFKDDYLGFAREIYSLVEHYRLYRDIMKFWHSRFPGKIYDLNYERLTEEQDTEIRKLVAYVGLEWDDACLRFHESKRAVKTSSLGQVRNPMYTGSSQEWKKFEVQLQPMIQLLDEFGY